MHFPKILLCSLFWAGMAFAQTPSAPVDATVTIKAETNLRIKTRKTLSGTIALVELRDNLFLPLEGQKIIFSIGEKTFEQNTVGGVASFDLSALPYAEYETKAIFEGTSKYTPSSAKLRLDIAKNTPLLEVSAPVELSLDDPETVLLGKLTVEGQPIEGAELQLEGLNGSIRKQQTDYTGSVSFPISPKDFLQDGLNPVTLRFLGDSRRNGVESRRMIALVVPVHLVLQAPKEASIDEDILISGELSSPLGAVPEKSIALFVRFAKGREIPLGSVKTQKNGQFKTRLDAKRFRTRKELSLLAKYQPDTPWHRPAESEAVQVVLRPPRPVPAAFYLVPLFVCAAIALGMVILRRLRRREIRSKVAPRPKGGVRNTNPSTTIGPEDFGISGTILDAKEQTPIAQSLLKLSGTKKFSESISSNAAGYFLQKSLPADQYRVRVEAKGYISETFEVSIPHRGKWREIQVALLPVREKVLEIFRDVAVQVLPESSLWGHWTPREIRRFVRKKRHAIQGPLAELVLLFETVYFSGEIGNEQTIQKAEKLAEQAMKILNPVSVAYSS